MIIDTKGYFSICMQFESFFAQDIVIHLSCEYLGVHPAGECIGFRPVGDCTRIRPSDKCIGTRPSKVSALVMGTLVSFLLLSA